jgi:hypothetical protein
MRAVKRLLVLALLAAVPVAAAAAANEPAKETKAPTVADFAVMLAATTAPTLAADKAAETLARAGVPLGDLDSALTEGRVAQILSHYGLRAETDHPGAVVSRKKAESTALLVSSAGVAGGPGLSPLGTAAVTLQEDPGPEDCPSISKNHGECINCCKNLFNIPAKSCQRYCISFTGKASPSEPLP